MLAKYSRIYKRLLKLIDSYYYRVFYPREISNKYFLYKVGFKNITEYKRYLLDRNPESFVFAHKDYVISDCGSNLLKINFNKLKDEINRNINNDLFIHGYKYSQNNSTEWHNDPVLNKKVSIKYYRNYGFNTNHTYKNSVDPILIFKLNTHQHLVRMSQVYRITREEKIIDHVISELNNWINTFPIGFGYPYLVTLNVSQRIISWCFIISLLKSEKKFIDEVLLRLIKSLYTQGKFIHNNLSKYDPTNNFLLSELTALRILSYQFPEFDYSKNFRIESEQLLQTEFDKQINNDGTSFENSTGYYKFVAELVVLNLAISKWFKADFSYLIELLNNLLLPLLKISNKQFSMPHIGDVSLERAYWFEYESDILKIGDLLNISSFLADNEKLKLIDNHNIETIFWWFNTDGIKKFSNIKINKTQNNSVLYKDGGLAVLCSNTTHYNYKITLDCGDIGLNGLGGHGHNDFGSFTLWYKDYPIIIDRGTYTYFRDSEKRNEYRSTLSHNICNIDNKEISILSQNLFGIKNGLKPKINSWINERNFIYIELEHHGYERLHSDIKCIRKISIICDKIVLIEDVIYGSTKHQVSLPIFFDENINFNLDPSKPEILGITNENNISLFCQIVSKTKFEWFVNASNISKNYGKEISSSVATIKKDIQLPCSYMIKIYNDESALMAVPVKIIEKIQSKYNNNFIK